MPFLADDKVNADQPNLEDLDEMEDMESAGTLGRLSGPAWELVSRFLEAQTFAIG